MVNVEDLLKSSKFFVDTCSLMHAGAENFFYKVLPPLLERHSCKIIIPEKVVQEINKHQQNPEQKTRSEALSAASILREYIKHGMAEVRGDQNDPFADNVFLHVFTKYRTIYNLTLLTQDRGLSNDLLNLRDLKSVKSSKQIHIVRLDSTGNLKSFNGIPFSGQKNNCTSGTNTKKPDIETRSNRPFRLCTQAVKIQNKLISVNTIPGEGDFVLTKQFGRIKLGKQIGEGGEGAIYSTENDYVCKIYSKDKLTTAKKQKLELMVSNRIEIPGVCWPLDTASNQTGVFVGYVMTKAKGIPMQKCMFIKPLLMQNFPDWNRVHLVTLAITILEKIKKLHNMNILLGDINPLNILIKSENDIFFVDTDSYQVEEFACPVGMANYTAPEIQGCDFKKILRTYPHEHFAVATLLFMILLPGKPPYSHQGGGDPTSNIKKGEFSYPLGDRSTRKTPEGPWRFIWSNLPYKTKEAFYNCFKEGRRLNVEEWMSIMYHYRDTLKGGHVTSELFPTSLKSVSEHAQAEYGAKTTDAVELRCSICENFFSLPAAKAEQLVSKATPICHECFKQQKLERETGEWLICKNCGDSFLFSIADSKFYQLKGIPAPRFCKKCRQKFKEERETGDMLSCEWCRRSFLFSVAERRFYAQKGYDMPKRCPNCRKAKKGGRMSQSTFRSIESYTTSRKSTNILEEVFNFFSSFWEK